MSEILGSSVERDPSGQADLVFPLSDNNYIHDHLKGHLKGYITAIFFKGLTIPSVFRQVLSFVNVVF